YYRLLRRGVKDVVGDPELRLYLGIIVAATALITGLLLGRELVLTTGEVTAGTLGETIKHSLFQVVSIQTTTGFCTVDFNQWPFLAKFVLVGLMFIGASAGSTGGGIKVIRILIAGKVMLAEIERVFRPNVVRPLKVGTATVDPELRTATLVYVLGIPVLFAIGAMALMLLEPSGSITFTTAATASAATLNNIGPGLAAVGAVENYGWFSSPSLIVMSVLMALGRLEVYAVAVLLLPRFWRTE
ncbi:MAG: potassium transporter TrkG, partial [Phycisphaeraceae bacterium]|nr:potassium transporter TrkG [Phycisphaeraceae bacterium]